MLDIDVAAAISNLAETLDAGKKELLALGWSSKGAERGAILIYESAAFSGEE